MLNLKKFIAIQKSRKQFAISSSKGAIVSIFKNQSEKLIGIGLQNQNPPSNSDIEKFNEEISKITKSEDFIDDLSNNIGKPLPNESEDEFVNRAKQIMTNLLKNKLSK
jgi:hypothetical protein